MTKRERARERERERERERSETACKTKRIPLLWGYVNRFDSESCFDCRSMYIDG